MAINWKGFNPKYGIEIVFILILAAIFAQIAGLDGVLIVISAAFIMAVDRKTAQWQTRLTNFIGFTVILMVVITIAWLAGDEMWPVVIALSAVTLMGSLSSGYGPERAMEGQLAATFLLVIFPSAPSIKLLSAVIDVALGGLLVLGVGLLFAAVRRFNQKKTSVNQLNSFNKQESPVEQAKSAADPEIIRKAPNISRNPPVIIYSVSKTLAVGLSTLVGWIVVGGHPFWATLAPMVIIRPDAIETANRGFKRIIGTLLGAVFGFILFTFIGNPTILYLVLIAVVFLWFSSINVDYAIFVFFMTAFIVLSVALEGGLAETLVTERIIGTILGVLIAFAVVFIQYLFIKPEDLSEQFRESGQPDG